MLKKNIFSLLVTLAFGSQILFGQDTRVATQSVSLKVAGSALLAITGPPVSITLAGALEAGGAIQPSAENKDTRLRMSSQVNNSETRAITAIISQALEGTTLEVELATPNTNFANPEYMGTLKGLKSLSNTSEATLIDGIGTCWTGTNVDDGYVIHYVFKAISNAPVIKSKELTVTFTISSISTDQYE